MSPALLLIFAGAASATAPGPAAVSQAAPSATLEALSDSRSGSRKVDAPADRQCQSHDAGNIVVCAQRPQGYRLDPSVMEANQEVVSNSRSASSAVPAAQAACGMVMVCGKGLESLDWANVAIVVGTMGVRAAKGQDWTKAFKTGGSGEYQLYQQAKQRRETRDAARAAAAVKMEAEKADREAGSNASTK